MKRGILSVLIALALCLGLLPVLALAAGTGTTEDPWTCGDGVTAVLDNRTLTISPTGTGTGAMTDYAFSSDRPWNSNMDSILKVVIQEGVTSIGKNAFETSWSLTSVEIPETVTSIGQAAFQNCYKLNSVNLPAGLTSIESNTFLSCKALTSIEIPASVETIGTSAFNASGLTEVTIPEGVTAIGDYAFRDCKSLTTVNIPASVETIGEGAFQGSTKAEIHYPGTTAEWNDLIGSTDIGVQPGKLHTSDSDHTVTISGIGPVTYSVGATVSVSAGTMAGKIFTGWTATGLTLTEEQAASPSFTFIMPANDVTLTASWAEAVAMVDDVGYATVQAAFAAAAQIEGGGTVTLLKNVDLGTEPIRPTAGTVTLTSPEGKKYTLTGSGLETIFIMQNGAALKVENVTVENTYDETDMGSGVKLQGVAIMVAYSDTSLTIADPAEVRATGLGGAAISSSGTLKILGGTVIAMGSGGTGVSFNSGTAKVEGGTISGAAKGLNINSEVDLAPANTVLLTGGTFTGTTGDAIFIKEARPNTLGDLVEVGSAIVSADTQRAVDMTGKTTGSGTFTVGCGHASVGTVTASEPESGVVTVTGTCQKCGETVTLGTLTMVNNGLTIAYGDTPTLKVQPSEELGVTKYEWPNKGSGAEYTPNTDALSLGTLTFTCKVTFADQGGTSHDVDVTFTLNVEKLNITNAKIRVLQGSDASNTVPYNGQGQKPAIEGFLINDNGFPSSYFDVSLVDASGTAAETRTDAGTYKIKLTGKDVLEGTKTLESPLFVIEPATPTIVWEGSVEEYLEYTGKPVAPSLTPTVTVAGMDSYDGEAVTYSYTKEGETATQNGLPTNPGTYYIKAAVPQQKNYTAAGTETALKLIITKAAAKITVEPKAANPAYNGKPQALVTAAEASVGEVQYALSADGPWSASIPTATAPGEYTVWYKVDETANYTGVGAQSVKATIGKATAPDVGASLMVKNNQEKTYTLDLSPYLPALPQGQEYGELTYKLTAVDIGDLDYIAENTVSLVDTVLTVPVNKVDKTDEGSVAVITVTIQSDNFQDIRLTVSVTATNKTPLIITGVTAQGWTYDGTVHPGYTGTPRAEGYTGEFLVTYLTGGDKQLKDAGTFSVVFTPMDTENYAGELQLPYTVEQAQVTVTADNKTATVGDELPELTYQVSGLAEGEELKTEPTPACDADMSKAGSYPITFSGAVLPDGGNYKAEIVYQNGTLTVSEKPAPPVNPDDLEIKLEVKEGFTEVPPALRALEHLNTP